MGKSPLEGSASGTKAGEGSLAAPLLAAGLASGATSAATPATTASSDCHAGVSTGGSTSQDRSSTRTQTTTQQVQVVRRESTFRTHAAYAALHGDSPLMLLPLSFTPAIALEPHVQSVDLFANVKAYDHGQGCCTYLCTRCAPIFDWVGYLHAEALQRPRPGAGSPRSGAVSTSSACSLAAGGDGGTGCMSQQGRPTTWFVDAGQAPAGSQATLVTLFGNRQLVFRAVQEVNRAYSNFWRLFLLVLLLLVLFLPGIGLLALLLIGCSSSIRKVCDDAVLQQMRAACEKADQRLAAWGVGLLLMEGYLGVMPSRRQDVEMGQPVAGGAVISPGSQARNIGPALVASTTHPDANAADALAAAAASPSHSARVWVLRVYMLPRGDSGITGAAPAAATTAVAHASHSPSRVLPTPASRAASSPSRTSGNSSGALQATSSAVAAAPDTSGVQSASAASKNFSPQKEESATSAAGTEQNADKALCDGGAGEQLPVQQNQQECPTARPVEVLSGGNAPDVKGVAAVVTPAEPRNGRGPTSADVATVTAAIMTAPRDVQPLQPPTSNTRTLMQRESEQKKKKKNKRGDLKVNDMQKPLLCQDHAEAV